MPSLPARGTACALTWTIVLAAKLSTRRTSRLGVPSDLNSHVTQPRRPSDGTFVRPRAKTGPVWFPFQIRGSRPVWPPALRWSLPFPSFFRGGPI